MENNFSFEVEDIDGFGKVANAPSNLIKEIGNTAKNNTIAGEIAVDTVKSVLEAPFEFSKNYEENVDINKQRRLRDIYAAGLVLNENDIENLNEQREKIKNKYNNQELQNISEHDF